MLATEFGVSRPVIREALSTLSALDVLDVQMGRGAFVSAAPTQGALVPLPNLQDVVNVREVLETGALQLGAREGSKRDASSVRDALERLRRAVDERSETTEPDRALHKAIIEASGSSLLCNLWESLEQQIEDTIRIIEGDTASAIEASQRLHEQNREFLRALLG
jgi:DNA-binding FadR family transcriptional regulator